MAEKKLTRAQEHKDIEKTVKAHGTLSEEIAEVRSADAEVVSEEMIEEEVKKERKRKESELEKEREALERAEAEKSGLSEKELAIRREKAELLASWVPKTKLG